MVDIRQEWVNTYLKFRILADYTDFIIGISEHDQGGFLVEQGYFTALETYFQKTHVLKREYTDLTSEGVETNANTENPYIGMQTAIFEMLDEAGRLYIWTTEDDLINATKDLP
jgi:hypothetical protein